MIQVIKVTGESLSPFLLSGDYVVVLNLPRLLLGLKAGDWIVFQHPVHGTMIKQLAAFKNGGEELFVLGFHPESTDSRQFGSIPRRWVTGKVIVQIKKPLKAR